MSIVAYVGLPRSGKSYTAVEQVILPALRQGRIVVTNLPLHKEAIERDIAGARIETFSVDAVMANPDSIFDTCPNGAVVVLDEVWRLWPAGKKVDKIPEAFKSFLAEHGHRVDAAGNAQHVVLITQDLAQIAAFARQLVEQTFRTTKMGVVGLQKRFRTDVYAGSVSGPNPPQSQVVRQIFGKYEARVYQYYVSHTMSEASEGGADERSIDRRANVLMRPMMIAAPFLIVGLVWFGISRLWHDHDRLKERAAESATAGGRGQIPGAPRTSAVASPRSGAAGGVSRSSVAVLFFVDDLRLPARSKAYLVAGERVLEVPGSECRLNGRHRECLYHGDYYDEVGLVESGAQKPVGTWSAAPAVAERGPGVQGGGLSPPGAASQRDARHGSS